jgi:hypothetical protein
MIENELFDQNWRTRRKADQVRYVVLKWTFCFAIGILTGIVGFFINLAVENVAGFKHQAVSALMDSARCGCSIALPCPFPFLSLISPTKKGFHHSLRFTRRQMAVVELACLYVLCPRRHRHRHL